MAAEELDGVDEVRMKRGGPPHPRSSDASLDAVDHRSRASLELISAVDLRLALKILSCCTSIINKIPRQMVYYGCLIFHLKP